ncbi:hypothetical protein ES707_17902 [subsurface metagenome]
MAVNGHKRVNSIAQTLRHPASFVVLNHSVNVNIGERNIADAVLAHHHHARDP